MSEIKDKIIELEAQKDKIAEEIGKLIKPFVPEEGKNLNEKAVYNSYTINTVLVCDKSPINCCMYDFYEDMTHTCCLFCSKPEERK